MWMLATSICGSSDDWREIFTKKFCKLMQYINLQNLCA